MQLWVWTKNFEREFNGSTTKEATKETTKEISSIKNK